MGIIDKIFDLVFPPRCVGCEKLGYFICPACTKRIGLISGSSEPPKNTDILYAVAHFKEGVTKEALHAYKYQKLSAMAPLLAEMLVKKIKREKIKFDILAYVPISRKRKAWRGFNQSELLAKALGKSLRKPVFLDLRKIKETETQVGLNKKEREINLRSAFACDDWEGLLKNKRVLLIDDVTTTGATLSECAKIIKKSGAKTVTALVLAKE